MSLSIQVPTVGQANSTEAVKVSNSLTNLASWANGNIPGTDLSPTAAILRSQLAGGGSNLVFTSVAVNTSAADGFLYNVTTTGVTITLPAATAGRTVGITAGLGSGITGALPVTIARSGADTINGLGIASATSMVLGSPGAVVVLQGAGSAWLIVGGQQDTGWVAITLLGNWVAGAGRFTPQSRLIGDRVWLRGGPFNNGPGSSNAPGTIVAAHRPSTTAICSSGGDPTGTGPVGLQITSAGALTTAITSVGATSGVSLDGASYSLS